MERNSMKDLLCNFSNVINIVQFFGFFHTVDYTLKRLCKATNEVAHKYHIAFQQNVVRKRLNKTYVIEDVMKVELCKEVERNIRYFKVKFIASSMDSKQALLKLIEKYSFLSWWCLDLGTLRKDKDIVEANNFLDELVVRKVIPEQVNEPYLDIMLNVSSSLETNPSSISESIRYVDIIRLNSNLALLSFCEQIRKLSCSMEDLEEICEHQNHLHIFRLMIDWHALKEVSSAPLFDKCMSTPLAISTKEIEMHCRGKISRDKILQCLESLQRVFTNVTKFLLYCCEASTTAEALDFIKVIHQFPKIQSVFYDGFYNGIKIKSPATNLRFSDDQGFQYVCQGVEVRCQAHELGFCYDNLTVKNLGWFKSHNIQSIHYEEGKSDNAALSNEPTLLIPEKNITEILLIVIPFASLF